MKTVLMKMKLLMTLIAMTLPYYRILSSSTIKVQVREAVPEPPPIEDFLIALRAKFVACDKEIPQEEELRMAAERLRVDFKKALSIPYAGGKKPNVRSFIAENWDIILFYFTF